MANNINSSNLLVFSYTNLWHPPRERGPFQFCSLPFAPLSEGLPKSFVACLAELGQSDFPDLVATNALRSSWQEVQVVGMPVLFHSH